MAFFLSDLEIAWAARSAPGDWLAFNLIEAKILPGARETASNLPIFTVNYRRQAVDDAADGRAAGVGVTYDMLGRTVGVSIRNPAREGLPLSEDDPRKAIINRLLQSPAFHRSPRSSELLMYLCRHALTNPGETISEQQIAVDVFGRKPGYNSSEDTIARVQVSQLRKKLQYYFLAEGREDPIVIEIPPGSYVPVFQPREPEVSFSAEPLPAERKASRRFWNRNLLPVLLACSLIACASLVYQNYWLRHSAAGDAAATPALNRLWTGVFHRNRPLQIVLSDASLMELSDMVGRRITLREYRDPYFPRKFLEENITNPATLLLADKIIGHVFTTTQDADAVWQIGRLTKHYSLTASVIAARDFRMTPQGDTDLILLGHTKSNPWMELFEDRMNFHYVLPPDGVACLANKKPMPGELPAYPLDHPRTGYCVVAFEPKPIGSGNALLLLGTDMSSLEAGLRLISEDSQTNELLRRIDSTHRSAIPFFEVLVKVKLLGNVSPGFEFVAQRVTSAG